MNVKVNRNRLMVAISAKREEAVKQHAKDEAEARREFVSYKRAVVEKASKFLTFAKSATSAEELTKELTYGNRLNFPDAPKVPSKPNTAKYDRALASLALVDEETVTLNDNRDSDFLDLI